MKNVIRVMQTPAQFLSSGADTNINPGERSSGRRDFDSEIEGC
jgi:hypothetical protein